MTAPWERYAAADTAPAAGPWSKYGAATAEKAPDPTGSTAQNIAAGAGKAVSDVGLGASQVARSILPKSFADFMSLPTQADVDEARRRDAPLMSTKAGSGGNIGGNMGLAALSLLVPGSQSLLGASVTGSTMGMLQPTVGEESRTLNTAAGGALGAVGQYGGRKLVDFAANRVNAKEMSLQALQAQNLVKDTTLAASREAGYVVPPTQANPRSAWNRLLEGFAGKASSGQAASVKNQEVTNRLAREALDLPADAPLTKESLREVRTAAGEAYKAIAAVPKYATDAQFTDDLARLSIGQRELAKEIPELADEGVLKLVESLQKSEFSGRTVIELTKTLRDKAGAAFRAGETEVGRFYRGASEAVEGLIERNLEQGGNRAMLGAFREARQTIAKAHTIEAALNEGTGNVVAAKLAAQFGKGKLSGELETAGRFAQAFPKAAQDVQKTGSILPNSPLDWTASSLLSVTSGDPTFMAGVMARPALRSLMYSKPYQAMMASPNYDLSTLSRMGPAVGGATGKLLPYAAPATYFSTR